MVRDGGVGQQAHQHVAVFPRLLDQVYVAVMQDIDGHSNVGDGHTHPRLMMFLISAPAPAGGM